MAVRYVLQNRWIEIKKELWYESILGNPICAYCGKRNGEELAHALVHKRYGKVDNHKWINVKENACPCCRKCQKLSETKEGRQIAWEWLCNKYGTSHMNEWKKALPYLIKEF